MLRIAGSTHNAGIGAHQGLAVDIAAQGSMEDTFMIRWLYNHYALTSSIALYYMVLLGYGTAQMFGDVSAITAPAASAYLGLLGLPPGAIGLIKWRLSKDNGVSDEQV